LISQGVCVSITLMNTPEEDTATPPLKGRNRFRTFLVVLVLVAVAFGAGVLWGEMRLRKASAEWKAEQQKLETSLAENAKTLDTLKATQALWEIDGLVSEALADLADNNFGLAHDVAEAARLLLEKAAPGLAAGQGTALAPLEGVLKDLGQGAAALSLNAKIKAREARSLLRAALKDGP
jgi:hypothetical protein